MTIEQTVEIPASHRLVIDVPREIPAGRAVLAFTAVGAEEEDIEEDATEYLMRDPVLRERLLKSVENIRNGTNLITFETMEDFDQYSDDLLNGRNPPVPKRRSFPPCSPIGPEGYRSPS